MLKRALALLLLLALAAVPVRMAGGEARASMPSHGMSHADCPGKPAETPASDRRAEQACCALGCIGLPAELIVYREVLAFSGPALRPGPVTHKVGLPPEAATPPPRPA